MSRRLSHLALLIAGVCLSQTASAQQDRAKPVTLDLASSAVARVKAAYFAMDYAGGVREADRALERFPRSRELAAWRAANLSRTQRPTEAKAAAEALLEATRDDPWGWFAMTLFREYADNANEPAAALQASLEAYRRAPRNPDMVWVRAVALAGNREAAKALALIDSAEKRGALTQPLRTIRGNAMYALGTPGLKTDQAKVDSANTLFDRARQADTMDAAAYVVQSSRMMNTGRNAEAYTLARKGAELAPLSLQAHQNYWRAIGGLKDRTQAARDSEVVADVNALVAARPDEPTVLEAGSGALIAHGAADRARELEDHVLAVAPASMSAELVLVRRQRVLVKKLRDSTTRDAATRTELQRMLWAFVDRPTHVEPRLLGEAYRGLFEMTDSTTNADTLLTLVRGMVKYEGINPHFVFAEGPMRLAQRGRDFAEAAAIARAGVKEGKKRIDQQKEIYETVGDYARDVDWMASIFYDALGYVFLRQGMLDSAEYDLRHALDLNPKSINAFAHLGLLAEQRGKPDDAEQSYIKGSLLPSPEVNPNGGALQRLYQARHGSLSGYDAYLAGIGETDRANRKAAIAKSRITMPVKLAAFSLKTLEGRVVSVDSLRGRVAVINNWGMWCGPCVAELPEFQKLAMAYAGDSSVHVLTIDNDPNTDELRKWMAKKQYTFTTLIDDGYLSRHNIHAFPTTWFLDRDGRVVFVKEGWSEKLVEEFSWRIDMIRQPEAKP